MQKVFAPLTDAKCVCSPFPGQVFLPLPMLTNACFTSHFVPPCLLAFLISTFRLYQLIVLPLPRTLHNHFTFLNPSCVSISWVVLFLLKFAKICISGKYNMSCNYSIGMLSPFQVVCVCYISHYVIGNFVQLLFLWVLNLTWGKMS